MAGSPTNSVKRAANAERDIATSFASDSIVHGRAGSRWTSDSSKGRRYQFALPTSQRELRSSRGPAESEAVTIDYNHPDTLCAAFDACETLFLLAPNALNQTDLELNAVKAAKAAGVRHIVKQSVMGAAEEDYSLARIHRPVEKAIETSGLAWTFLRPNSFMQNVVTFMAQTIRAEGAFYSASDEARISHIDVRDIAAVTVAARTTEAHESQIYTLTGPEALTYDEMAEELSTALGRAIRHISLPPLDLKEAMLSGGMPEAIAERMLDLERYFREDRAATITDDVKRVTGRVPRPFADYVRDTTKSGVWNADVGLPLHAANPCG